MKQAVIEFVGYPSAVVRDLNTYLHNNPAHRIITTSSSPAGHNGQISFIVVIEGDETINTATTLRDTPYFTHAPFPPKK